VIFQAPGNLIATHEQGPRLYPEFDPALKKIPGIFTARFESTLLRCSHRIKHTEVAFGHRPPVVYPGLLVTSVPECGIAMSPIQ